MPLAVRANQALCTVLSSTGEQSGQDRGSLCTQVPVAAVDALLWEQALLHLGSLSEEAALFPSLVP